MLLDKYKKLGMIMHPKTDSVSGMPGMPGMPAMPGMPGMSGMPGMPPKNPQPVSTPLTPLPQPVSTPLTPLSMPDHEEIKREQEKIKEDMIASSASIDEAQAKTGEKNRKKIITTMAQGGGSQFSEETQEILGEYDKNNIGYPMLKKQKEQGLFSSNQTTHKATLRPKNPYMEEIAGLDPEGMAELETRLASLLDDVQKPTHNPKYDGLLYGLQKFRDYASPLRGQSTPLDFAKQKKSSQLETIKALSDIINQRRQSAISLFDKYPTTTSVTNTPSLHDVRQDLKAADLDVRRFEEKELPEFSLEEQKHKDKYGLDVRKFEEKELPELYQQEQEHKDKHGLDVRKFEEKELREVYLKQEELDLKIRKEESEKALRTITGELKKAEKGLVEGKTEMLPRVMALKEAQAEAEKKLADINVKEKEVSIKHTEELTKKLKREAEAPTGTTPNPKVQKKWHDLIKTKMEGLSTSLIDSVNDNNADMSSLEKTAFTTLRGEPNLTDIIASGTMIARQRGEKGVITNKDVDRVQPQTILDKIKKKGASVFGQEFHASDKLKFSLVAHFLEVRAKVLEDAVSLRRQASDNLQTVEFNEGGKKQAFGMLNTSYLNMLEAATRAYREAINTDLFKGTYYEQPFKEIIGRLRSAIEKYESLHKEQQKLWFPAKPTTTKKLDQLSEDL